MKTAKEARVGDTFINPKDPLPALPGFKAAQSMLFAGIFPSDGSEFEKLSDAIDRLTLNDNSVQIQKETSSALGQGWRIGFLGLLHMDVFRQRLEEVRVSGGFRGIFGGCFWYVFLYVTLHDNLVSLLDAFLSGFC